MYAVQCFAHLVLVFNGESSAHLRGNPGGGWNPAGINPGGAGGVPEAPGGGAGNPGGGNPGGGAAGKPCGAGEPVGGRKLPGWKSAGFVYPPCP